MAKKNIQDDGSYQKKQIGKAKGRFDKKEEEWEPPIESQLSRRGNDSDIVKYQPLDADGRPVFGMKPFSGEAAEMLSKANRKKAFEEEKYLDIKGVGKIKIKQDIIEEAGFGENKKHNKDGLASRYYGLDKPERKKWDALDKEAEKIGAAGPTKVEQEAELSHFFGKRGTKMREFRENIIREIEKKNKREKK